MFDLEKAIASWRHSLKHQRVLFKEDVDELERHVRDHVDALVSAGMGGNDAFQAAMVDLGDYGSVTTEYRKVYWRKIKHRHVVINELIWSLAMLKNYLKISLRNLKRYKINSLINVSGLSVGMACVIVILFYIQHEFSFDRFHENAERIYRITVEEWTGTPLPLADVLLDEVPGVLDAVRMDHISDRSPKLLAYQNRMFYEDHLYLSDPSIFDVFSFEFVYGSSSSALEDPNSIVLTESVARKYFLDENPLGKSITYENERELTVTGIIKDLPPNTHFTFEILAPFALTEAANERYYQMWGAFNYLTYVILEPGVDPSSIEEQIPAIFRRYRGPEADETYLYLQPLSEIHLNPLPRGETGRTGDIRYIYLYSALALVILLIACMNFTNLTAAHSLTRSKEVGVRKVLGAQRLQLIVQFVGESIILSLIALPVALLLSNLFSPYFKELTGITADLDLSANTNTVVGLAAICIASGILAGSYPGIFASAFKPVKILRGILQTSSRGVSLKNILITIQFAVSVFLICCMIVMSNQMGFIRNRKLGLDKEQLIIVSISREMDQQYDALKNELSQVSGVLSMTGFSDLPSDQGNHQDASWEGLAEDEEGRIRWMAVDYDFIQTFGMDLNAGRDFSADMPTDFKSGYILNEAAVKSIGWDDPIGKEFEIIEPGTVIGVVSDFHYRSLHHPIEPFSLYLYPLINYIGIKIGPGNIPETLDRLEYAWSRVLPDRPFDYSFYDDDLERIYQTDMMMGKMFAAFAFLAIFLAVLGLFGLTAFVVENRTKEIGIRKVMGASVSRIIAGLSGIFLKMVLVANLLSWPLAYLAMDKWLNNFSYRIDLNIWVFVTAGAVVTVVAFLTIASRSFKTATANPVESLRYE